MVAAPKIQTSPGARRPGGPLIYFPKPSVQFPCPILSTQGVQKKNHTLTSATHHLRGGGPLDQEFAGGTAEIGARNLFLSAPSDGIQFVGHASLSSRGPPDRIQPTCRSPSPLRLGLNRRACSSIPFAMNRTEASNQLLGCHLRRQRDSSARMCKPASKTFPDQVHPFCRISR